MLKESPDHYDAELVLRIYDLRRETVMRESRDAINQDFWPRSTAEALAVLQRDHPLNRAYRQTSSYWEMVYGMARHGVIHAEFLVDSGNGEGLLLLAKVEPYLEQFRQATSPRAFRNAEWIATQTETGRAIAAMFRARVAATLGAK